MIPFHHRFQLLYQAVSRARIQTQKDRIAHLVVVSSYDGGNSRPFVRRITIDVIDAFVSSYPPALEESLSNDWPMATVRPDLVREALSLPRLPDQTGG